MTAQRKDVTDNLADGFYGRLSPWLRDISSKMYRWILTCKDWHDILDSRSITDTLPSHNGERICMLYLDPPYDLGGRSKSYSHDSDGVAGDVRKWLYTPRDDRPAPWYDPAMRILLSAYEDDFEPLPDARMYYWERRKGMEDVNSGKQRQEVLYANPACMNVTQGNKVENFEQVGLF